jgi:hypothetical protein
MFAYGELKQLPNGYYAARVTNEDGSRVLKQLNNVTLMSDFSHSDVAVFNTSTQVGSIQEVDSVIVRASKVNSTTWFGKELSPKTLETAYGKSISAEGEIILYKMKGFKVYDHNRDVVDADSVALHARCDVIAELSNLTFSKKSFKSVWKLVQVKLRPPRKSKYTDEYLFEDEDQAGDDTESEDEMI